MGGGHDVGLRVGRGRVVGQRARMGIGLEVVVVVLVC